MVKVQSITPDEYKSKPSDFKILYSLHSTPFGNCLIGIRATDKSILHLSFVSKPKETAMNTLKSLWPNSELIEVSSTEISKTVQHIFSTANIHMDDSITVLLKGTNFQIAVWKALLSIPKSTSVFYEDIAQAIGKPKAIRAVGNAISKNQIAYLIPCHRVKGKTGSDKYSWGVHVKHSLLELENKW